MSVSTITTKHRFHQDTWENTWTNVGIDGATDVNPPTTARPTSLVRTTATPAPATPRATALVAGASPTETELPPPARCVETGPDRSPACAVQCTKKFWRWSFWVTQYNVDMTLGNGEHQGIGIIGYEYQFDPRFPASAGLPRAWDLPAGGAGSFAFDIKIANPENAEVQAAALCAPMVEMNYTLIHNHGRTLATREPSDIEYSEPPIHRLDWFSLGPIPYDQWRTSRSTPMVRSAPWSRRSKRLGW